MEQKDPATLTDSELEQYRDQCYQARLANKDRTGYGMAERVRLLEQFQRATRELNKRQK